MTICTGAYCYPQPVVNSNGSGKFFKKLTIVSLILLFLAALSSVAFGSPSDPGPVRNRDGTSVNANEYRRIGNKLQVEAESNFRASNGSITQVDRTVFLKYQTDLNLGLLNKREMLDYLTQLYGRKNALLGYRALEEAERDFLIALIH